MQVSSTQAGTFCLYVTLNTTHVAFAGIKINPEQLQDFLQTMDQDNDGHICFREWRDFLLLLPRPTSMPEIFEYYKAYRPSRPGASQLTQDGDVTLHEKPLSSSSGRKAKASGDDAHHHKSSADVKGKGKAEQQPDEHATESDGEGEEAEGIFAGVRSLNLTTLRCLADFSFPQAGKFLLAGGIAGAGMPCFLERMART
jgi:solute carrier family 25 phosphate transporter 23/24/25/41